MDGLLYHQAAGADSQRATLHVEAAGASCHAEQCLIGRATLTQRYAPRSSAGAPTAAPPSPEASATMVTVVHTGDRPYLNLPRSPPIPR